MNRFSKFSAIYSRQRPTGFTLIELLIVALIISIISGAVYQMTFGIEELGDRLQTRMDTAQAQMWIRHNWRSEVELASAIEISEDGRELLLTRRDAEDRELRRRYRIDDEQRLVCEVQLDGDPQPQRTRRIHPCAEHLEFTREGRLVKMSWTALYFDGRQTWRWPSTCEAAALFAEKTE